MYNKNIMLCLRILLTLIKENEVCIYMFSLKFVLIYLKINNQTSEFASEEKSYKFIYLQIY